MCCITSWTESISGVFREWARRHWPGLVWHFRLLRLFLHLQDLPMEAARRWQQLHLDREIKNVRKRFWAILHHCCCSFRWFWWHCFWSSNVRCYIFLGRVLIRFLIHLHILPYIWSERYLWNWQLDWIHLSAARGMRVQRWCRCWSGRLLILSWIRFWFLCFIWE